MAEAGFCLAGLQLKLKCTRVEVLMTEQCLNEHLVPNDGSLKVTSNFKMDFLGIDGRMKWV